MATHRKKYNYEINKQVQDVFRKMLGSYQVPEGNKGIVDFYYKEFIASSDQVFRHESELSKLFGHLESQGLITCIQKGLKARRTRMDVRNLLSLNMPEIQVNIIDEPKKPIPAPPIDIKNEEEVQLDSETTISVINDTIKGMLSYMQESHTDMIHFLTSLANKLQFGDPDLAKSLQEELLQVTVKHDQLVTENKFLKEELIKKPEVTINAHMVIRSLHKILDETERMIATPGWQKAQKTEHYRKSIISCVEEIKKEVAVGTSNE